MENYVHKLKEAIFGHKPNDPNETHESVYLKTVQAVNEFVNDLSLFHSINKSNAQLLNLIRSFESKCEMTRFKVIC